LIRSGTWHETFVNHYAYTLLIPFQSMITALYVTKHILLKSLGMK